jgi:microcystin-dependent protein
MDPFVAEVRIFAGNFAPTGWATCDGQLFPISQNTALYSLLGTTYGGDGKSNFALPNLEGSAVIGAGQGAGLSPHDLGETGGQSSVTLLQSEIPSHSHSIGATDAAASTGTPSPQVILAAGTAPDAYIAAGSAASLQLDAQALAMTGNSMPHNNMQPYLTLLYIIALQGVFPPRS